MIKDFHFVLYWTLSLLLSLAAVVVIGYKWWEETQPRHRGDAITVSNIEEVQKAFKECKTIEFEAEGGPKHIPIGFFIQSFSFMNANDVNINGYIWMKFPKDLPQDFVEAYIFPEEVNSNITRSEKIYSVDQGDHKLLGWYFDVIVRQSFEYSNYPLDAHSVWLRIWSKDFIYDQEIILVPDFVSYQPQNVANSWFGLDVDIVPSGWKIVETYFSYKCIQYDTSFGFADSKTDPEYNELFYNIEIQRKFIDAFIINLVPLYFVTLLLFAMVMTVSGDDKRREKFGFNTMNTVAICASLLFVVILLHIQARRQFVGSEIVYIEYFYFIVYLVIFLTALNSYLFSLGRFRQFKIIHFKDNLISKVSYWPVVLWMMAVATWLKL